ncbi:acyltransferase family protein [Desulfosporosinus hippei]|uniref:Peptidoglycan/LPS O-acetylase OafA/YrhL, contains acyltransferase and SGNH-hydrolase domains n=1 Tax=Desulfosporosinus hippei DSM 8344 TaxID=1121419 RepID=A0A1G8I9Q2_9FIRM|nr:acyltransferase family protein [Desulfosporosinus hippei]SDI15709.1 Peptidoglycan/LPS O-acetylase OafA/YrhL, contains acyltransferase and SGNH-hydrolase domains [Desulfosporosinus hippei DSM 8344]
MNCSKKTNQVNLHPRGLQKKSIGYMPGLDGLRALAVFAVIAYHLNLTWIPGGLLGVNLFFVLSGYLITGILLKQWELSGGIDLKDFWLRRARRLLPALFVMLAGVMSWVLLWAPERLAALKQEALAALFYTSNWYLIFHQVSYFESFGPPSPLGHLWSLAVEEQFYLFWPLLLAIGLRCCLQRKWIIGGTMAVALTSAAAMALIYIPGHDPSRVYYGTDTRAFALLIGAALAMVWPSWKMNAGLTGKKRLALDLAGSLGLLVVLLMIGTTDQYQPSLYQGGLLLYSVATAGLVATLAHPASYLGRIFGWGPLRWLGECSYGIYLWHYPVIILTNPGVNTEGLNLSRTLWQIGVSIILAALSRYLIEEPIRYGRRKYQRSRRSNLKWWQRPLAPITKISLSILLMFLLLFVTLNGGMHISEKALAKSQVSQNPAQTADQEEIAATQGSKATDKKTDIQGDEITIIGDSLMINVEPVLQKRLPGIVIDAQLGRQMYQAPDLISRLEEEDKLGKIVMLELGTNGSFTDKQLRKTLDSLERAEEILLVNTRVPKPWEREVNETLTKVAESYPNIKLIDWHLLSSGHEEYFYPDGVHLTQSGVQAYGEIVLEALISDQMDGE